jgi:hypothetical protein
VVRFAASIVPVGALLHNHASAVYAALATLEEGAPGGVAWFNHELFSRASCNDDPPALFSTSCLTLEEVARHERCGKGPFV